MTDATLTTVGLIGKLTEAQAKMDTKWEVRFQALTDKMSRTDDRLNVLINVVERHIHGHNGPPT